MECQSGRKIFSDRKMLWHMIEILDQVVICRPVAIVLVGGEIPR